MFLHLRWYGIDVEPYRTRSVNALWPVEDAKNLQTISKRLKIPCSEILRRSVFSLKEDLWTEYNYWKNGTPPPKFRKHSIREEIEERFKEPFLDPENDCRKIEFSAPKTEERVRIGLSMAEGDLQFLKALWKKKVTIGDYLSYLLRTKGSSMTVPSGDEVSINSFGIKQCARHAKITFGIRTEDDRILNECIDRKGSYFLRYNEKLTRSEVVVFAYHLFQKMTWKEQQKFIKCEEKEGKRRGNFKKISVGFSQIGYLCSVTERPKIGELRAAIYSLLRDEKFLRLVGG